MCSICRCSTTHSPKTCPAGALQWLEDELQRRQANLIETQVQEGWYRMPGVQTLYGHQLGIVRELWVLARSASRTEEYARATRVARRLDH